jgi:hypothetical protein
LKYPPWSQLGPEKPWAWLAIGALGKVILFLLLFYNHPQTDGSYAIPGGDTGDYFIPIESLLQGNGYDPDFRLPGYSAVYLVLRLSLEPGDAKIALVFLQWLMSVASIYFLAIGIWNLTNKYVLFVIAFVLYLVSSHSNIYDNYLLTESFATSSLIFSFYFLTEHFRKGTSRSLIWSGIFICWCYFLRPVMLPLIMVLACFVAYKAVKEKGRIRVLLMPVVLFVAPFVIAESLWVGRNFRAHHEFILITQRQYTDDLENSYHKELIDFVIAWGGDRSWWVKSAEIRWFMKNGDMDGPYTKNLPSYIYTSAFNQDSLLHVRDEITRIDNRDTDSATRQQLTHQVKHSLARFTTSIREEKPLLFFGTSKLYLLKIFLLHSGTQLLFPETFGSLGVFEKGIKIFYSAYYYFLLLTGLIGSSLIIINYRKMPPGILLLPTLTLFFITIFPVLGHVEFRYFTPGYPFLILCACIPIAAVLKRLRIVREIDTGAVR